MKKKILCSMFLALLLTGCASWKHHLIDHGWRRDLEDFEYEDDHDIDVTEIAGVRWYRHSWNCEKD